MFAKYGIDWDYYNLTVKQADLIALNTERFHFLPVHPDWVVDNVAFKKPKFMDPSESSAALHRAIEKALARKAQLLAEDPEPEEPDPVSVVC